MALSITAVQLIKYPLYVLYQLASLSSCQREGLARLRFLGLLERMTQEVEAKSEEAMLMNRPQRPAGYREERRVFGHVVAPLGCVRAPSVAGDAMAFYQRGGGV